ncbi:MAG: hypothetical protein A2V81_04840 [Candidatus Abawacabacteria bacterium RBG_16_42_10]|uniref:Cysteine desulfurase n=1 Tax=Candidatus Abawacabacteria bacterium RBG_16_42_10 TaxID=1817814 RepID=A0A1F4XIR5_9BACT|nr:MAG: hypothetical protein A2V81_04840 [Candidatus Abawacabacteria bacterium RBG_16_42_10]
MPSRTHDISLVKKDFPIFEYEANLVYLDNASTSQTPKTVTQAMDEYYEQYRANTHRGLYKISEMATEKYEASREKVANFIHAENEEIVFTKGATHSLNILAYGLCQDLRPGDEIILTEMEHHSNLLPWQQMAKQYELVLKFIPLTEDGRLDMSVIEDLINPKTKILSVTHMSNVLGTINNLEKLEQIAHKHDLIFIVDACQSIPHIHINVRQINCDFLVFSGHKMLGPTGIGVLYGKKALLEKLPPLEFGGHMVAEASFHEATWADSPYKFEAGTMNIAGVIGFGAAVDYLEGIDREQMMKHEKELTTYALNELQKLSYIEIHGPKTAENKGGVISFNVKGVHSHDVAEILARDNIAVRAGHHCAMPLMSKLGCKNSVRVSFYLYNEMADIDKLLEGLDKVNKIFFK